MEGQKTRATLDRPNWWAGTQALYSISVGCPDGLGPDKYQKDCIIMIMNPYGIDTQEYLEEAQGLTVLDFIEKEKQPKPESANEARDMKRLAKQVEALKRPNNAKEANQPVSTSRSAIDFLRGRYALTQEEVKQMESEEVLYPNLIIRQHIVVLIGKAGSGKTTLCFYEVAPKLAIQGHNVLYCDADSPALQRKQMVLFAEANGFIFIDPTKTSLASFMKDLKKLAEKENSFKDAVLFFDTLKKFANIFDKKAIKRFFMLCRKITRLGGTIVLLGHANKHLGKNGELVFEGLGDIQNDTDELLFLEHRPRPDGGVDCTVITDPGRGAKVRGFFEDWSFHITSDREIKVYDKPLDLNRQDEWVEKALRVAKRILREVREPIPKTILARHVSDETGIGIHRVRNLISDNASMDGQGDTIFSYSYGDKRTQLISINNNYLK